MKNKNKITKTLKDFGRLPIYRISAICGIPLEETRTLLHELLEDNEIQKLDLPTATYWEAKR